MQMSLLSSGSEKRRVLGTTGWSISPQSLVMIEQIRLEIFSKHMKDIKLIGSGQHVFMKEKSYLTILVTVCREMSGSVVKERAANIAYLDFSNALTVSHDIPIAN